MKHENLVYGRQAATDLLEYLDFGAIFSKDFRNTVSAHMGTVCNLASSKDWEWGKSKSESFQKYVKIIDYYTKALKDIGLEKLGIRIAVALGDIAFNVERKNRS